MAESKPMTPLAKKITQKISVSPGLVRKTVTETVRFNEGTLKRSLKISVWSQKQLQPMVMSSPNSSTRNQPRITEESSNNSRRRRLPFLIFIIIGGIALLPNLLNIRPQNSFWPLKHVTNVLESTVFGQQEAITSLAIAINELFLTNGSGVIFVTGPVGVGKTLASSIIQQEYPWQGDVYFEFADNLVYKDFRKPFYKNLLIVEDCHEKNRQKTIKTIQSFDIHAKPAHPIIILLIFTHKTDSELKLFIDSFQNYFLHYYHVPFKSLDRQSVKKCIEKFISTSQINVDSSVVDKLVDKQLEVGEGNFPPGCKQIDTLIFKTLEL